MKSFKSIREGNSEEPGVSEIDDVQDDPMSFVEIKPKKSKVVKEDALQEAISVKKEKHSWGKMMTVHHGSETSYPLHPEHQAAIKKLRPGMKTTFKDETNSTVHAHREDDTVHLHRPKTSNKLTSLPYHHFDESVNEAYTEDDIAKGGTIIYKKARSRPGASGWSHHMSKVSHKTGGGAGTIIHAVNGHKVPLNHVVSTDASDWKGLKEDTEQIEENQMSHQEIQHAVQLHSMLKNNTPNMAPAHGYALKNAHMSMIKKHGTGWRKKAGIAEEAEQMDEKLTSKDIKMAVGVSKDKRYAGGNMTGAVKTMEKIKPGLSKHPRVQQALRKANEGVDFNKVWESIKPEEVVIGEEAFDPVAHKKEADRLMGKHIAAHKEVSKAFANMKSRGETPSFNIPENQKLNDIKKEIATHNAKIPRKPSQPGSAAHYYASKKPGEYTGD